MEVTTYTEVELDYADLMSAIRGLLESRGIRTKKTDIVMTVSSNEEAYTSDNSIKFTDVPINNFNVKVTIKNQKETN